MNSALQSLLQTIFGDKYDPPKNQFEKILDEKIRGISLYNQALQHSSTQTDRFDSNERKEFLGDSVLGW